MIIRTGAQSNQALKTAAGAKPWKDLRNTALTPPVAITRIGTRVKSPHLPLVTLNTSHAGMGATVHAGGTGMTHETTVRRRTPMVRAS